MLKLSLCCLESWIAARGTFKLPIRFWQGALTGDLTYTQSYMKKQGYIFDTSCDGQYDVKFKSQWQIFFWDTACHQEESMAALQAVGLKLTCRAA
jgi:hypothetical protein